MITMKAMKVDTARNFEELDRYQHLLFSEEDIKAMKMVDRLAKITGCIFALIGAASLYLLIEIGQGAGLNYYEFMSAFFGFTEVFAGSGVLKVACLLLFVPAGIKWFAGMFKKKRK